MRKCLILQSKPLAFGAGFKQEPTHLPTRLTLAEIYLKRDFAKRSLKLLSEIQRLPMSDLSQEQHYLEMVLSCGASLKTSKLDWAAERMLTLQPDHLPSLNSSQTERLKKPIGLGLKV